MLFTNYLKNYYLRDSFDSLEIGIPHGKFFLGIENITPKKNIAFTIDVSEDQSNNLDGSEKGNLEFFEEHINKLAINKSRIKIVKQDSLQLRSGDDQLMRFKDNQTIYIIDVWAFRSKKEAKEAAGKCKFIDDNFCINS